MTSAISRRHAFLGDAVIACARVALFEREPVEVRRVEPVHPWPAVEPVADISRHAFFTRDGDETRHEAVIAIAVD